jgi:hypothetical protein
MALTVAGVVALVVCAIGWFMSSRSPEWRRFDDCHYEQGIDATILYLDYSYESGQQLAPRVEFYDSKVVVSLEVLDEDGDSSDESIQTQAAFDVESPDMDIEYPDGSKLSC